MSWPSLPLADGTSEDRKRNRIKPIPAYLLGMVIYAVVWTPTAPLVFGIAASFSARNWSFIPIAVLFGSIILVCMPPVNIVWATWIAIFGSLQFFLSRPNFVKISRLGPEMPVRRSLIVGLTLGAVQAGVAVPVAYALGWGTTGLFGDGIHQSLSQVWVDLLLNYGLTGFAGSVACGFVLGLFLRKVAPVVIKATT